MLLQSALAKASTFLGRAARWAMIFPVTLVIITPVRAQTAPLQTSACEIHLFPADGPHSVGEDFDAVKRVDQDLKHYYEMAGRSLNWLTPERQLEILRQMGVDQALGSTLPVVAHAEPLSRHEALDRKPEATSGCQVELLIPQIMLERGGLSARSIRVFGIVRRYENGQQVSTFSGYAAAPMPDFQLRSADDAQAATQIVEVAYRGAVEQLLQNATKTRRK